MTLFKVTRTDRDVEVLVSWPIIVAVVVAVILWVVI